MMKQKQALPILLGALAVLLVVGVLWFQAAHSGADATITTAHTSTEVSGAGLRAHIAEESTSDPQYSRTDEALLAAVLDEQVLYKETVTRDYGGLFSVIFTAYFTDAERSQCVYSHLQPQPLRVEPILDNVDFVITPTTDVWAMFCRYIVRGIVETSGNRQVLSQLGTVEKEPMFGFSGNIFYGSDAILYQQLYSAP